MSVQTRVSNKAFALSPPVQRKVYFSDPFSNGSSRIGSDKTRNIITKSVGLLNSDIPEAEEAAENQLSQVKSKKTPRQLEYIRNPTAANWGNCVEEQLDPLAISSGWTPQVTIKKNKAKQKSRPDYVKQIDGFTVYVDLTTEMQSGSGAPHVTGKLYKAGYEKEGHIVAADITHASVGSKQTGISKADLKKIQKKNQKRALKELDEYIPSGKKLKKKVQPNEDTIQNDVDSYESGDENDYSHH